MTRISFYLLKGDDIDNRQVYACRLAEKAYKLGHHVYIHTNTAEQCTQIDDALWSFRSDSFVPHQLVNDTDTDCPVLIGYDSKPPRLMDVLINLNDEQPLFFSQFDRLIELIDDNETVKVFGRQRYQFYKHRGYQIETHHI